MKGNLPRPEASGAGHGDRERGQDLIEFALIAPVLILLLFGILQTGLIVMQYNTVANAAREGARHGITMKTPGTELAGQTCVGAGAPPATVRDAACRIASGLTANQVTVFWDTPPGVVNTGSISVTVKYPAQITITPLIESFGGSGTIPLSATSIMQREQ
jgi:Flp pilus assembly protein TadG